MCLTFLGCRKDGSEEGSAFACGVIGAVVTFAISTLIYCVIARQAASITGIARMVGGVVVFPADRAVCWVLAMLGVVSEFEAIVALISWGSCIEFL